MVEYTRIAVLLVVVLGRYVEGHHGEGGSGTTASVFYMIQPPHELPCNPFINGWSREYGRTVLQCYVAVSQAFIDKTRADVSLLWYSNVTISKDGTFGLQRRELDTIKVLVNGYIIYKATQLVEGYQISQDEYWCQVYLNDQNTYDSVVLPRSSVTTIRSPQCYQHLPSCTQDIPLGLPVALTVISDHDRTISDSSLCSSTVENGSSGTAIQELTHQEEGVINSLSSERLCNGTGKHDGGGSNAAVITSNVFLSIFIVFSITICAVLIVKYIKQRKSKPRKRRKDVSNKVMMRTHNVIDGQLKQLRRVSSLPDIRIHSHKGKAVSSDALSDSGIVGDATFTSATSDPVQPGNVMSRVRNYYKGLPLLGPKSKSEDCFFSNFATEGASTLDRSSQARDSYVYVTPNPVTFPMRKAGSASVLPPLTTQPGVYLTIIGSSGQPSSTSCSAIYDGPEQYAAPIYEAVGDINSIA